MSKKDRLKAKKEKQDKIMKNKELEEQREIEQARSSISKSAQRYIKKAKKEKKANYEGKLYMLLKLLMLVPLAYSGVFYCGVTAVGIVTGNMNGIPKWVATVMVIGSIAMITGVIFAFFKKYIISFSIIAASTISYMSGAVYIINKIKSSLETYSGADPELMDMDKDYMLYYYPILIVTLLSFVMAVMSVVKKIKKRKRLQEERDNAPVKSIVE